MWIYDLETLSFLEVNDAAIHNYGYSREEFLGMTIKDIRPQEDIPALLDNVSRVTEGLDAAGIWRHRKKDGSIIYVEITSHTLTFAGRLAEIVMADDITERWHWEERMEKLNRCFLGFGPDPVGNINSLTALCGELLGASSALYNRLDKGTLCSWGMWNPPPGYNPVDNPDGHICYDTIRRCSDGVLIIRNLQNTLYARTDPNVKAYKLRTYIGRTVKFGGDYVGSLCVVYQNEFIPTEDDIRLMELIASAIGVEENRRGAKEALRQSKEFAETVLNSINDAISIIDIHDFRIIDTNRAFLELYGLKKEEAVGKHCYGISHKKLHPCIPPEDSCPLQETLKTKESSTVEQIHYLKDGKTRHIEVSASPIKNETGEITSVVHVARDITERRRAEAELRKQREEYQVIFDSVVAIIWYLDREGRIIRANKSAAKTVGLPIQDIIGKSTYDLYPDDAAKFRADDLEVMDSGKPKLGIIEEYRLLTGEKGWARTDKVPYRDKDGNIIGVIVLAQDITEQKRAEEKLQLFRNLIDRSNDAVFVNDPETGRILDANDKACSNLGYTREELLNMYVFDIEAIIPDRFFWKEHTKEIMEKGYLILEGLHRRKDGTVFPVEVNVNSIAFGKNKYMVAVARDITERKQAERILKENARAELYSFIVSALPAFASGVPSQVRNILVKNFAERFEKNIKPRFEEEMKHLCRWNKPGGGSENMQDTLEAYISWLEGLFSSFGIRTKIIFYESGGILELLNCPWKGEASGNPIFCLICRTIVMRSLTWTSLKGRADQKSSIANGSQICGFRINVKSTDDH